MISIATKLSRIAARSTQIAFSPPPFLTLQSFAQARFFTSNERFKINPIALQTINHAYSLARSLKTDDSYAQGLLMLEKCEANLTDNSSKGLVLLAMSKLLSERGNYDDALEKFDKLHEPMHVGDDDLVKGAYGHLRAVKGLMELGYCSYLSRRLDDRFADDDLVKGAYGHLRAVKGLMELVRGYPQLSGVYFEVACDRVCLTGFSALSYAEFLHMKRNFSFAKELYEKVIDEVPENEEFCDPDKLNAIEIAMFPRAEDISLAATCSLGQLEAHMGNFADSEEILNRALTKTELYGSNHPKVGVVLTCMALMLRYKAMAERSSSLIIQEGLYRKAIEVLKAPPLETPVAKTKACRRDVIALARGGYAETVCVEQNRKVEGGERIKSWAESAWRSQRRRLSLAEALDISQPSSKVPVIDLRISRAF